MNVTQPLLRPLGDTPATVAGRKAVLFMALFGLSWAIVENVFGVHLARSYNVIQVVWMRYGIHLLLVLAIWGWRPSTHVWRDQRPATQLGRSAMMLIMPLSAAWAFASGLPPFFTWALFWISPLLIVVIAIGWRHERVSRVTWIALGLGMLGVVAAVEPSLPTHGALAAPVVMALSFAIYVVMTRSLRTEHLGTNLFYTALVPFVVLSAFVSHVWVTPSPHDLIMAVGIGTFGFVSLLVLDRAVSYAPVSDSAPALFLQIVFGACVDVLFTEHRPYLHVLGGMVFICAAAGLAWAFPLTKEPHAMGRRISS